MRILVLTEEATLAIALSQMPFGHDIVAVDSIDQLEGHDLSFQVALVDLGTTRRGLVGVSDVIRAGVSTPCLVVGDESPIDLALELAPDASVILRPFSLEELDAHLEELAVLALRMRQADLETEISAEGALTPDDDDTAVLVDHTEAAAAAASSLVPQRIDFRSREPQPLDREHQARIERTEGLLDGAAEVERFLEQAPEVVDRRAVAERLLESVEQRLWPLVSALWIPREGGGYEPLAARHLDGDEHVPFDQSLFLSFETNLDSALVAHADPSQHPVVGIPGVQGGTLIAAALRVGEALQGVVIAGGDGYTEADRDQLQLLATESAPALAVAQAFERLRSRRPPTRDTGRDADRQA
ncbi:MAG: hypothetical protein ABR592_07220 [Nitriliruptorales bacterium]